MSIFEIGGIMKRKRGAKLVWDGKPEHPVLINIQVDKGCVTEVKLSEALMGLYKTGILRVCVIDLDVLHGGDPEHVFLANVVQD